MAVAKWILAEMTWPEVREVAKEDRVAVLPTATIEDHGYHLPIDTDALLTEEVCKRAVSRVPDKAVLVAPVIHGFSPHHMDFPGAISVGAETFVNYVRGVCNSLGHHGFRRILIVNGHGSNRPLVEVAARLVVVESQGRVMCGAINYGATRAVREAVAELRESEVPGGMNHACEFETSVYMALRESLVQLDKAEKDLSRETTEHFWYDSRSNAGRQGGPVALMEWWSSISRTGVMGDPTVATKEKGKRWLEASVQGLVEVIEEFKHRKFPTRVDHH